MRYRGVEIARRVACVWPNASVARCSTYVLVKPALSVRSLWKRCTMTTACTIFWRTFMPSPYTCKCALWLPVNVLCERL